MSTIEDVVNQMTLGLPETEVAISHGFPTYKVRGKAFAIYSLNHHGDNKVALLLKLGKPMQQSLVESAPKVCYVPPYNGPSGWVGFELNKGFNWQQLSKLCRDSYASAAPASLARDLSPVAVEAPTEEMTPEQINPMLEAGNQKILARVRKLCLQWPEVEENSQWGNPNFKAGKKSFANLSCGEKGLVLQFWAGTDRQQALVSFDKRFCVPAYVGSKGWLNLRLPAKPNWQEVEGLLLDSYKHFALQRMLRAL